MNKYINDFIDYQKLKNYSNYTITNYKNDLYSFYDFTKKHNINNLKDIDYQFIRLYLSELFNLNYKNKTIARHISALRSFFKYLLKENIIDENPMILISNPKQEQKLPHFLYYNELEIILNLPDKETPIGIRDRLLMEILYSTGIRVGELVKIKITDINIENNTIKVLGKGNKERIVYFGKKCRDLIIDYLNYRNEICENIKTDILLINQRGGSLTARGIRNILNNIAKLSGLNITLTPHVFRHTYATHMLNEGADLKAVKDLLGHENISTTGIYTHVSNEQLRNVYLKNHPRAKK